MKTPRILFLSLIFLGIAAGTGFAATSVSAGIRIGPSGRATVDVGFFYDDLATYGNWIERPSYGWAWRPRSVSSSWRPYQEGHWVWTDEGWTWISDEPYGWATYHYGRWYDDPDYGWEWIPGDQWAPAWVAWQEGNDYVGWAPLPPTVDFRPGIELNVSLAPEFYVFVPERQFLAPRISSYVVPPAECVRIFPATRNITRYDVVGNRIVNPGVPVDRLQRVVGRPVPRYQIADLTPDQRHRGALVAQNRVAIFRPQVAKVQVPPPPSRPIARRAVIAGAAAAAIVAAHHANRAQAPGSAPSATAREQARAERRQIAQAPPNQQQAAQQQRNQQRQAQRQAAQQQGEQQKAQLQAAQQQRNQQRQAERQATQQQGEQQKAQLQAAQQQRNQQRQAERQAAQQQAEQQKAQRQAAQQQHAEQRQVQRQDAQQPRQRQPERQAPPPPQQGQRQAQRQPPPQPKNQGKPPGKPHDEKQKPPPR
jgi:DNA segregation ATPase FtsK/SpoIIIE-like protein